MFPYGDRGTFRTFRAFRGLGVSAEPETLEKIGGPEPLGCLERILSCRERTLSCRERILSCRERLLGCGSWILRCRWRIGLCWCSGIAQATGAGLELLGLVQSWSGITGGLVRSYRASKPLVCWSGTAGPHATCSMHGMHGSTLVYLYIHMNK